MSDSWFSKFLNWLGVSPIERITVTSQFYLSDGRIIKSSITKKSPISYDCLNELKSAMIADCEKTFEEMTGDKNVR